jgi:hypothetical protein
MTANSPTADRASLHALVDALPETELAEARRLLSALTVADPALRTALLAPLDDEPFTDEDRAAVEEAEAGYRRGEWVSHEEMKREFGL